MKHGPQNFLWRVKPQFLVLCVAGCLLATLQFGCDSSTGASEGSDSTGDAAGDVAVPADGNSRSNDAFADAGGDGDGDSRTLPECADGLNTAPGVFTQLSDRQALNTFITGVAPIDGVPRCGAIGLLDVSEQSGSKLIDHRAYTDRVIHRTMMDERLIVVTSKASRGEESSDSEQNIIADVFDIQENRFRRVNRTSHLLDRPLDPPIEIDPLSVVNDGENLVLVGTRRIVELHLTASGDLEVTHVVDRRDEILNLTDRLVERWEQRDDPQSFKPRYSPSHNRHLLLDGGYLVEVEQGVSVWDVSAETASQENPDLLVDYIPMYRNLSPGFLYSEGDRWAYNSNSSMLYIGDALESKNPPDGLPEAANEIAVIDLSDPSSPTVAARWHADKDFSPRIYSTGGRTPEMSLSNGYLALQFRPEPGYEDGSEYMHVLDVEEHPTTVHEVYSKDVSSFFGSSMLTMIAEEGRIFWAPFPSPSDEDDPIRWRPISEVIASQ